MKGFDIMEKSTKIIIIVLSVSILFSLLMSQLTPKDDNLKENPIYLQIKQQEQKEQYEKEKKEKVEKYEKELKEKVEKYEKESKSVKYIYFTEQKTVVSETIKYNSYHKLCHGANYVNNV